MNHVNNKTTHNNQNIPQNFRKVRAQLVHVVIGVDPAVTHHKWSCETGFVVAGRSRCGKFCILEDASGRYKSKDWVQKVVSLYDKWSAHCVVVEVNREIDKRYVAYLS